MDRIIHKNRWFIWTVALAAAVCLVIVGYTFDVIGDIEQIAVSISL